MKNIETLFSDAKVLVVEDYDLNLEIITEMLRMMGIHADVASNGEEAVEKAKQTSYDLILMDILMPKVDGYQATKQIRELSIRQPIISALTASIQESDRQLCLIAGMDDILAKPLTFGDLEEFLRKHLPEKLVSPIKKTPE